MNVFLEVVRMISYDFIYLIKVCEDVFNVFTHIHSVAVPQSANLESPTARWWQRKGRAGSFQGAQRVGLFQTCPAWSSTMFHPEMIMFWSFQWWFYIVLHGFFMGFSWVLILGGSKIFQNPNHPATARGVAWRHGLPRGLAESPRAPAPGSHRRPAGESSIFGGQNHGTAGTMIPSGTSGTCSPKFRDL